MELYESIRQVVQSSLQKAPEDMLEDCLNILIDLSGASGGSILGEEGPHLQFLFSDVASLIGVNVPWDSIAGATASQGAIIYTYAPSDKRHYDGIDEKISHQTRYLLSIPIPSVHRTSDSGGSARSAGALQLLFSRDILPEYDVSQGARDFSLDELREQGSYHECLQEVFWLLPNISFGMEVMKLRQTSYQVIHELKNKMISASSWVNCLKEDIGDIHPDLLENEDVLEDFSLAQSSVAEGANLAKSYLQFTKLYTPNFEDTLVNDVLHETAASISAFAAESGCEDFRATEDFDPNVAVKQLDPSQLRMAFFNLGKNATEALIEHRTSSPEVRLCSQQRDDGSCVVTIADNGPGMPEEIAENLFVPFKTKKEGGTGLGLTITKKIVDIHGATIACETGGEGTRFVMVF